MVGKSSKIKIKGEIYHVCNRAVEGRKMFEFASDNRRFLETVWLVNTTDDTPLEWKRHASPDILASHEKRKGQHEKLVKIYALTLMPNHFHMLLEPNTDDGIPKFMQRLCNSFSRFYNEKHKRQGALFMSRYKAIHMESDGQVQHIFTYIHANPLDLIDPLWREGKLQDWEKAKSFASNYIWSSLGNYLGNIESFSLINRLIDPRFAENYFRTPEDHLSAISSWSERSNLINYELL